MAADLQRSLTERAKELLQVDGEPSIFELNDLLREYRKEKHPDNFQDEKVRKEAEEHCKQAGALIDELEKEIEMDRFNRKTSEMVVYKPLYEAAQLQSNLDKAKAEIQELKSELETTRELNQHLRQQVDKKKDESLREEIEYLQSLYKPSTRKFASLGLGIVLTGLLAVMSQVEAVSAVLKRHSPFGEKYIGTVLFFCLVLCVVVSLRKLWEQGYIRRMSEAVCSPKCASDFMEFLKGQRQTGEPVGEFSEVESFNYLAGKKTPWKSFVTFVGFRIFSQDTIHQLNEIFLHNLLNKQLVEISRANGFQRYFSIKTGRNYGEWYHEWKMEQMARKKA